MKYCFYFLLSNNVLHDTLLNKMQKLISSSDFKVDFIDKKNFYYSNNNYLFLLLNLENDVNIFSKFIRKNIVDLFERMLFITFDEKRNFTNYFEIKENSPEFMLQLNKSDKHKSDKKDLMQSDEEDLLLNSLDNSNLDNLNAS